MKFDFNIAFALPHPDDDPVKYIDPLYEAGFDDAVLGVGAVGMIGLAFTRETETEQEGIDRAVRAVENVIPGCQLVHRSASIAAANEK